MELIQLQRQKKNLIESDAAYMAALEQRREANTFSERVSASKALRSAKENIDTSEIDQKIEDLQKHISEINEEKYRRHREEQEKYGSLNDFKRAIRGSIIIDQSSDTSLDQLWQEAAEKYPDRFPLDTVDADMPDGIAEVVRWAISSVSNAESEWQYYNAENRNDLMQKTLEG